MSIWLLAALAAFHPQDLGLGHVRSRVRWSYAAAGYPIEVRRVRKAYLHSLFSFRKRLLERSLVSQGILVTAGNFWHFPPRPCVPQCGLPFPGGVVGPVGAHIFSGPQWKGGFPPRP